MFADLVDKDLVPRETCEYGLSFVRNLDGTYSCIFCSTELDIYEENDLLKLREKGNVRWDHFIPANRFGPTTKGNILPICTSCNSLKNDSDPIEFWRTRTSPMHKTEEEFQSFVNDFEKPFRENLRKYYNMAKSYDPSNAEQFHSFFKIWSEVSDENGMPLILSVSTSAQREKELLNRYYEEANPNASYLEEILKIAREKSKPTWPVKKMAEALGKDFIDDLVSQYGEQEVWSRLSPLLIESFDLSKDLTHKKQYRFTSMKSALKDLSDIASLDAMRAKLSEPRTVLSWKEELIDHKTTN